MVFSTGLLELRANVARRPNVARQSDTQTHEMEPSDWPRFDSIEPPNSSLNAPQLANFAPLDLAAPEEASSSDSTHSDRKDGSATCQLGSCKLKQANQPLSLPVCEHVASLGAD